MNTTNCQEISVCVCRQRISYFVNGPEAFCLRIDFATTIDKLNEFIESDGIMNTSAENLLEQLEKTQAPMLKPDDTNEVALSAQMGYVFLEWVTHITIKGAQRLAQILANKHLMVYVQTSFC